MSIREVIMDYLENSSKKALSVEELSVALHMNKAKDYKVFVKTLASLEAEHLLNFTAKGKVELAEKEEAKVVISGIFRANAAGFGFVSIDAEEPDVFVARGQTAFALDGDEVFIEIDKNANALKGTSAEGHVVEIIRHDVHQVVGTFVALNDDEKEQTGLIGFVKSRNKKIPYRVYLGNEGLIPENKAIVRVEITHYPDKEFPQTMQGLVTEIIGQADDQGIDVLEVLASMDIVSEFPKEVLDQAEAVPEEVPENEIVGRVDYRNEITFTIDGADAKDLDDAVHAKRLENGNYELGVHIADVSHYVTENSPLDKEAYERGTSVYVTDRVVPMLPERLSNGICSLNPRINRLTQSCVMEISPEGRVINYQISQSIIKTTERMTYDAVNQMIAGDEAALENYAKIADSVKIMVELHHILEAMRKRRGAIDFDTVEAKIIVNEKGLPIEIRKRTRGIAERMIESFMLEANETVATHFEAHGLPFIYRIHEQPKADRLQRFIDFAATFGMQIEGTSNGIDQKVLQAFMKKIKGQPGEMVLSTMLLRSMQQARYSENNEGHFGLAAENYTHFTSPIRRYPDLLVHRLIREIGEGKTPANILQKWEDKIPEIAEHSSHRERRAVDAEREVEKMKKAEFMEEHVGEEFEGIIASVTRFGMFIELENTIEGLVHISTLKGDYFNYQERMLALIGERSGLTFKIGQPIKIKVVKADRMTGEIDFEYLPSELDLIDKAAKAKKKPDHKGRKKSNQSLKVKSVAPKSTDKSANKSKNSRRADEKSEFDKKKKKSVKKPFYSKAAKGKFTDKKDNGKKFTDGRKKPHKRG